MQAATMGWLGTVLLVVGGFAVFASVFFRKREGKIAAVGMLLVVAGVLLLIFGKDVLHSLAA